MQHTDTQHALDRLSAAAAAVGRDLTFMEVCGTHTMSAFRCGLHSVMPANVALLSGPGCPVCVTAQGDIDMLISAAAIPGAGVTVCTYGDMLRVPGASGSLEQARSQGADVRVVYSTLDAVRLAERQRDRQVVFAAVGFETTAPATAAAVLEAQGKGLTNFSVLTSHKLVIPAMQALLSGGQVQLQGFLCPGHVSVIIGAQAYQPIVRDHGLPCVIAGFEDAQMALGVARLTEMVRDGVAELDNVYSQAVRPEGNRVAQELIARVFETATVRWRGLGVLPDSGLVLRPAFREFDAQARFSLASVDTPEPAGCRCGEVITGRVKPNECALFGTACTPTFPIGPCMVSSEGTCAAWYKYKRA